MKKRPRLLQLCGSNSIRRYEMKQNTNTKKIIDVKAKKGQIWQDDNQRSERYVQIDRISRKAGRAFVHNVETGKPSDVRLDRLNSRFLYSGIDAAV